MTSDQNHQVAIVLSSPEYRRLPRVKLAEFDRYCDEIGERLEREGMNEEKLAQILAK